MHRGLRAQLDPGALRLGHASEEHHHHVVRLGARIDWPPDLWNPQLDAIVREQREGQSELVAVERALGLTDYHGIESTIRVGQCFE